MKYKIIEITATGTADSQKMAKLVNIAIEEGWRPIGGIAMTVSQGNHMTLAQAMVKE
jgi:hypothetical protein